MSDTHISHRSILDWSLAAFQACGLPEGDAAIIANALVTTSLWGIDSHGVARITHYLTRFNNGSITKTPKLKFVQTAAATGQLDGDDGHGIVIMTRASEHAIHLAKESGAGVVGVHNSSHCGAIGLYTRQIAAAGMVGMAFTQADSLVVPHGGRKPFFGTNPISIAFPTENIDEPICVDMATSIVPWNYIMNAKREKAKVPVGLGVDANGDDCVEAESIIAVKPTAEHKGYALAFLIDMLCGPLNGTNYGPNIPAMYGHMDQKRKLGSLVLAIDPARFGGKDNIRAVGTRMIEHVKTLGDNVLFPGQPEYLSKERRTVAGIPLTEAMLDDWRNWSAKLGITTVL